MNTSNVVTGQCNLLSCCDDHVYVCTYVNMLKLLAVTQMQCLLIYGNSLGWELRNTWLNNAH